MNVTTINITTVRLSNTESKVNYESDQSANRATLVCNDVVGNLSFEFSALRTVREGFPSHGSPTFFYAETVCPNRPGKRGTVSLSFATQVYGILVLRPLLPFPNEGVPALVVSNRACRLAPFFLFVGDSLPKRRKGWIKKRGYYEPSAPRI